MNRRFPLVIRTILTIVVACLVPFAVVVSSSQSLSQPPPQQPDILEDNLLSRNSIDDGWVALFDGETLFGWKKESNVMWSVKDGAISALTGEVGLLRTTSQFSDFQLSLEYHRSAATQSGVFVRTSPRPKNTKSDCFEINIAPEENPYPTGGIVGHNKATVNREDDAKPWQQMTVVCQGNQLEVWVNGGRVNQLTRESPGRGFIGLQFNSGAVAFKNVFLKPLKLTQLFNRKDLTGWDDSQKLASSFDVTPDGDLKIISGRGQLESKVTFADFVLQASCRTNAPGLNSGIFFRSIPGAFTDGYESQIQNQFVDDDPRKPLDCGTGGIFRRTTARKINAADQQWFTKTIVAVGPHISVWVNGYQVTDWTDKRKPNLNPRRGLRLDPGSIILQGHDPTTDILFGRIDARELTPRR